MNFKKLLKNERFYFFLYLLFKSLGIGALALCLFLMQQDVLEMSTTYFKLSQILSKFTVVLYGLCYYLQIIAPILYKSLYVSRVGPKSFYWIPLAIATDVVVILIAIKNVLTQYGFPHLMTSNLVSTDAVTITLQLLGALTLLVFSLKHPFFKERTLSIAFSGYWALNLLSTVILGVYHLLTTFTGLKLIKLAHNTSRLNALTTWWQRGLFLLWIVILFTIRSRARSDAQPSA